VASFLLEIAVDFGTMTEEFSSLSESGFIPTLWQADLIVSDRFSVFSSLSESGFIPTDIN